jgi:hypothetical protein
MNTTEPILLLTGFEPFGGEAINPSWEVAHALDGERIGGARVAALQVGGKKELTGRTDLDIEISNQCGRLIANAIACYNSAIRSRLLQKYEASGSEKALGVVNAVSPAAWRHVHLNGHYTFRGGGQAIDLDAVIRQLNLQ